MSSKSLTRSIQPLVPFHVVIIIESVEKKMGFAAGYEHSAKAFGMIDGEQKTIKVTRHLGWVNTDTPLHFLKFRLEVDADEIVPLVNAKNGK